MNTKKIASKLMEIAEHAMIPHEGAPRGVWVDVQNAVSYSMSNEYRREFDDLVIQFLKNRDWSNKFSEEFISRKLRTLFASIIKKEAINIEKRLKS